MPDDFEDLLRNSGPDFSPRDEHRRHLRLILLSKFETNRARFPLPMTAVFLGVIVLALALGQNELGSDSFDVVSVGADYAGTRGYKAPRQNMRIAIDQQVLRVSGEERLLEYILQQEASGQGQMTRASGWTINDTTLFMVDYAYDVEGAPAAQTQMSTFPPYIASKQQSALALRYQADIREQIRDGMALYLGLEDRIIDGIPVRFGKWLVTLPQLPTVVYWEGAPIEKGPRR